MTNELDSTLQDIEAKAERKREVIHVLYKLWGRCNVSDNQADYYLETIRKYIEEN